MESLMEKMKGNKNCSCTVKMSMFLKKIQHTPENILRRLNYLFMKVYPYCWWKKSCTSSYGQYPSIYKVLYMPGGAGCLPSTVFRLLVSEELSGWMSLPKRQGKRCLAKWKWWNSIFFLELFAELDISKSTTWNNTWKINSLNLKMMMVWFRWFSGFQFGWIF